MSYLLDTASFLWFVYDDRRLSNVAKSLISDPYATTYLSIASVWELAIKANLGRGLALHEPFPDFIDGELRTNRFELLEISVAHIKRIYALPLHHRDPFDRLLIAQSQIENIPVITSDAAFDHYSIQRLW
jgi:PIN domain nuclease of toxin-antitoxin system